MRALLRLYPAAWRHRYGDEVLEVLERRGVGVRSALDLVWAAPGVWLRTWIEHDGRKEMTPLLVMGVVLMVVGAGATGWAVAELKEGIVEIPKHWWSTAAVCPLLLGFLLTVVGVARESRLADWASSNRRES